MIQKEITPNGATSLTATAMTFGSQHNFPSDADGLQLKDTKFSYNIQKIRELDVSKRIIEDSESKENVEGFVNQSNITDKSLLWEHDMTVLNPFKEIPPIRTWATIGDRKAFGVNSIVVINAKQKEGKSYSILAIIKALITFKQFGTLKPLAIPRRILIFDLEMAEVDLQTRIKPIYNAIGKENWCILSIISMVKIPLQERLKMILDKTEIYNPDIIVIDTVTELLNDYNSSEEAMTLGNELKRLMADRTVFLVIHQNKSKEDTNSKGHIGTLVENYCSECYNMKNDKGVFSLNLKFSRFASNVDAEPFKFTLSDQGEIITCEEVERINNEKAKEENRLIFELIFGDEVELCRETLINRVMANIGCKERIASDKIADAVASGSLIKNKRGRNVFYKITPF